MAANEVPRFGTQHMELRQGIRRLCAEYPASYWRQIDGDRKYPDEFVDALASDGWLGLLIPNEYGGGGLGIGAAAAVLSEIHASGANAAAAHAQLYTMSAILRHGSEPQKRRYLPLIASGELRLQAFGVTEPDAGSNALAISTFARKSTDGYVISGQKVFTSRAEHSDLMVLLARTGHSNEVSNRTGGLSLFLIDLRRAVSDGSVIISPLETMINHHTTTIAIEGLHVSEDSLIGKEGDGFRYVIDGWNAERILIAAECVGDGYWFIERARSYARARSVFDQPIGAHQGIQFPIADAYTKVLSADMALAAAVEAFDSDVDAGLYANHAKYVAADASWLAGNVCLDVHGGYGFAREYDIERKFRETRLYKVAPVTENMILSYIATNKLGLPKSY